ncbi:MAG: sulfurtransferase TusA family protein [Candidatus Calescibacterium sp.]|nr:sulfurtransferase TusA family protein [Candidatus Calescibacterium sp.]MCX7733996.1 sulfurtransferase TusA family protein [bacterium]MDW8086405.1 sulfurtransferase TusA family protein [Candidatus Calescibacterium sp.]
MIKVDAEFDARGLKCPMPVIRAKKKLDDLSSGQVILVIADDPGAKKDFPAFCMQTGHDLIDLKEENGVFKFYIRKK